MVTENAQTIVSPFPVTLLAKVQRAVFAVVLTVVDNGGFYSAIHYCPKEKYTQTCSEVDARQGCCRGATDLRLKAALSLGMQCQLFVFLLCLSVKNGDTAVSHRVLVVSSLVFVSVT